MRFRIPIRGLRRSPLLLGLAVATISWPAPVRAEPLPAGSTLEDVLDYAEIHNPGLQGFQMRVESARANVGAVTGLPDPKLSYGNFLQAVETRVGPQRHRVGLSQTFPLFGKLGLRGDIARASAEVARARYDQQRLAMRFQVRSLWHDLYYLDRAIAIAQADVDLATYLEGVVRRLYAAGEGAYADVLKSQVELARAEDRVRSLIDRRDPVVAAINAQLNRAPLDPLPDPALDPPPLTVPDIGTLEALLSEANPELRALRQEAAQQGDATKLASRSGLPDLTVGADFIDVGDARNAGVPDSGKDVWMAHASINLPLWRGKYGALRDAAQARHTAALHHLAQKQLELRARLHRVEMELRDAQRKNVLYDDTLLPRARQTLEVTQGSFTAGRASFLDLIDARQTVLELSLAAERARADGATHFAELEMLVGTPLFATDPVPGDMP